MTPENAKVALGGAMVGAIDDFFKTRETDESKNVVSCGAYVVVAASTKKVLFRSIHTTSDHTC